MAKELTGSITSSQIWYLGFLAKKLGRTEDTSTLDKSGASKKIGELRKELGWDMKKKPSKVKSKGKKKCSGAQDIMGWRVGDVLHASVGYSMILNEYFQVLKLVGTTMVEVRRIKSVDVDNDGCGQSGHERPVPGSFCDGEKPFRARVVNKWGETCIKVDRFGHTATKVEHPELSRDEYDTYD